MHHGLSDFPCHATGDEDSHEDKSNTLVCLARAVSCSTFLQSWYFRLTALNLRLLPLAVLRLISFAASTSDLFVFVTPSIYLQVSMTYTIISATIPCLGMFLEGASPDFLGGHNYIEPVSSTLAGRSRGSTYKLTNPSRRRSYGGSIKLTSLTHGKNTVQAIKGGREDRISIASDSSRQAIVVQQTVDVRYTQI